MLLVGKKLEDDKHLNEDHRTDGKLYSEEENKWDCKCAADFGSKCIEFMIDARTNEHILSVGTY